MNQFSIWRIGAILIDVSAAIGFLLRKSAHVSGRLKFPSAPHLLPPLLCLSLFPWHGFSVFEFKNAIKMNWNQLISNWYEMIGREYNSRFHINRMCICLHFALQSGSFSNYYNHDIGNKKSIFSFHRNVFLLQMLIVEILRAASL